MKTYAIPIDAHCLFRTSAFFKRNFSVAGPVGSLLAILAATLPAIMIVVLAVAAFGAQNPGPAAAATWTAGLVFFALAVDSRPKRAAILAVSGLLVMLFAWFSMRISVEFGVLGAFIVAAWTAAAILGGLLRLGQEAARA